jgi:hypothetical protein
MVRTHTKLHERRRPECAYNIGFFSQIGGLPRMQLVEQENRGGNCYDKRNYAT